MSGGLEAVLMRRVPGVADLYAAQRRGDPSRRLEFLDAVDPGTPRERKWVVMLSTQYGCPVGCAMCDAGLEPYRGNVTGAELLDQLRLALAAHPEIDPARVPKLKVHFARMGEPSFNEGVLEALSVLGGAGRLPGLLPSVSSVAPRCRRADDFFETLRVIKDRWYRGGRFQLQFSVHTTDEEARRALVPIRTWSLEEMAAFGARWRRPGDRLVTLNVASLRGLPFDPDRLAGLFSPEHFLVKLTPVHPTRRAARNALVDDWTEPPQAVRARAAALERRGLRVIVNAPWPEETAGGVSCGQVAASVTAAPVGA